MEQAFQSTTLWLRIIPFNVTVAATIEMYLQGTAGVRYVLYGFVMPSGVRILHLTVDSVTFSAFFYYGAYNFKHKGNT